MPNDDVIPGFDDEKDANLKIALEGMDGLANCLVLRLDGYIDTYNSPYFHGRAKMAVDMGFVTLLLDCSGLSSVSSSGIGSLIALLKAVQPEGRLILVGINAEVAEGFRVLGFSRFFSMAGNLDQARRQLAAGSESLALSFPLSFPCPACGKRLKAVKPGRFRCSQCKSVLELDPEGRSFLG